KEGIKILQRAVEINPRLQVAYTWLARVYVQLGQPDHARQILQRGREADALQAQGRTTGLDPMAEIFQREEGDDGGTRDEKEIGSDLRATTPMEETMPTEQRSKETGAAQ